MREEMSVEFAREVRGGGGWDLKASWPKARAKAHGPSPPPARNSERRRRSGRSCRAPAPRQRERRLAIQMTCDDNPGTLSKREFHEVEEVGGGGSCELHALRPFLQ